MTEKLMPCPLCHGNNLSHGTVHAGITFGTAGCRDCNLEITSASEAEAITAWNTRPAREEVSGEELRAAVRTIIARCEALEDEAHDELAKDQTADVHGFWRGQKHTAKSIRRELHDLTRAAMNPKPAEADGDFETCPACSGQFDGATFRESNACPECETPFATPATEKAVEVRVLPGANSHCFDLRLVIGGPGDASKVGDGGECIAFADEPWASRIAAALAHPPAASLDPATSAAGHIKALMGVSDVFFQKAKDGSADETWSRDIIKAAKQYLDRNKRQALSALPEEPSA